MGTIDRCTYTLTCPKCGQTESASISDKGSMWSGSYWGERAEFSYFDTVWSGGAKEEPELQSASCKKCNIPPEVTSKYSL